MKGVEIMEKIDCIMHSPPAPMFSFSRVSISKAQKLVRKYGACLTVPPTTNLGESVGFTIVSIHYSIVAGIANWMLAHVLSS